MDQQVFDAIILDIASGEPAYKAALAHGIPMGTFWGWLSADAELAEKYARAKMIGLERMADDIIAIADDSSGDVEIRINSDGEEYRVQNSEFANRSRLRVDARKWLLSKLAPKKYGDRIDIAHSGAIKMIEPSSDQARRMAEAVIETARLESAEPADPGVG